MATLTNHALTQLYDAQSKLNEELKNLDRPLSVEALKTSGAALLLSAVRDMASCFIVPRANAGDLQEGLKWIQAALCLNANDPGAQLIEARALDQLDGRGLPQRLRFVITRLEAIAGNTDIDDKIKQQATGLLENSTVRLRYERKLESLVKLKWSTTTALSPSKSQKKTNKPIDLAKELRENAPMKVIHRITAAGIGIFTEEGENMTVQAAVAHWDTLSEKKKKAPKKVDKLRSYLLLTRTESPTYSLDHLIKYDAFRRNGACSISLVSWNAKMMNVTDQKGEDWEGAAKEKAKNIGTLASEHTADIVVIQEAPGPQLVTRRGPAKEVG